MGFKQPRVPEYREAEGVGHYMRNLTLFLKDFCMDSWKATMNLQKSVSVLRCYPVGSVYISADDTSPEELFGGKWSAISITDASLRAWKRTE